MSTTLACAYLSPSLVLLAIDWPDGEKRPDFLGFAVKRTPGFQDLKTQAFEPFSWLPNRLGFNGPPPKGKPDFPSNQAPIQKFLWWDARLEGLQAGQTINYEVSAVTGTAQNPVVDAMTTTTLMVTLPPHIEFGIGTWFNRAVMSSQAFSRKVEALGLPKGGKPTAQQALSLREWLANGMEKPLPDFIRGASSLVGAIYHLTDNLWGIPALKSAMAKCKTALVYDSKLEKAARGKQSPPNPNDQAIALLKKIKFFGRDKTNIMHNKYLVSGEKLVGGSRPNPLRLTCGSANYTTEGLTSQANLIHTFESPDLAALYFKRFTLLKTNPSLAATKKVTGWSRTISVGDAGIRVFFSPEPGQPGQADSVSMETIVQAVHNAQSSVVFCLFTPTDKDLREACFAAGDAGKMMFGLVNHVAGSEPGTKPTATGKIPADQIAQLEIYHRTKEKKDVIGANFFHPNTVPAGFEVEMNLFPGEQPPPYPPVIIHHKFIVIDAETESPTIYTGSANMSGNSVFKNDENLLEIKGSPRLARIYLAEFLRLYEHYRARAHTIKAGMSGAGPAAPGFALAHDRSWADAHYKPGTPEYKARVRMLCES